MAEVAPLLTPQGWQLVTPVAASGAATGGAVGGAAGLALAAAGAGILALAFLMAKRASQKAAAAGKGRGQAAGKPTGGGGNPSRAAGLLSRIPRPGGRSTSVGASGGSRTGGATGGRGRLRLPGRGKSGGGATGARSGGAGSSGGSKPGTGGATKKGLGGRLAGLRSKLPGWKKSGRSSGAGWPKGSTRRGSGSTSRGGSKAAGTGSAAGKRPGLARRALATARPSRIRAALGRLGRGEQRPSATSTGSGHHSGRSTSPRSPSDPTGRTGRVARVRGALGSLASRIRGSGSGTARPVGKRARLAGQQPGSRGTNPVARDAINTATASTARTRRTLGDIMTSPKGRRPSIPAKGTTGTGSSGGGGGFSASRTPHAGVIEAMSQSAHTYDPSNALRVVELYTGALESIDAHANMLRIQGAKTTEEFYLHPAAGQLLSALGDQLAKYRSVVEDARNAFETVHKNDLERIRNPQRGQDRWDIRANVD